MRSARGARRSAPSRTRPWLIALLIAMGGPLFWVACTTQTREAPPEDPTTSIGSRTLGIELQPASPTPQGELSVEQSGERPLSEPSESAAALVADYGPVGVAVMLPNEGAIFEANGETPFPMASLVKVPVTLTVTERAAEEHRMLSDEEREMLERMITISDNEATTAAWEELGGGATIAAYLRSLDIEGIGPVSGGEWGDTPATPRGVARLMSKIGMADGISEGSREIMFALLEGVVDEHRWGVNAGFDRPGQRILLKNGWYPAEDGWWVNSAGIVIDEDGALQYVLVVLSKEQPSHEEGIELIESIAAEVHRAMAEREVSTERNGSPAASPTAPSSAPGPSPTGTPPTSATTPAP